MSDRKKLVCGSNVSEVAGWKEEKTTLSWGVEGICSVYKSVSAQGLRVLLQFDGSCEENGES